MSDLFCAATLLLAGETEGAAVTRLVSSLRDRKVAGVYAAESSAAVRTAETAAAATGLHVHTVPGLADAGADETDDDVLRRVAGEFQAIADLYRIPEEGAGNLPPAPGRGTFRLVLPLGEGERASGPFRFGFGAMRKKPSPSLCRAVIDAGFGPAPVIDVPEALSVLKNRPMPYFLYHVSTDGILRADKIACARITLADPDGKVVSARMVWGDSAWRATNLSLMEAKGYTPGPGPAAEEFFAEDRAAFLAAREAALSLLPVPRVFEAFVFGPSGSGVEYCFQTVSRRPDGGFEVRWRNRESGGNWRVTL